MKKIFRMLIFSATAIYLTSLWNKGFIVQNDWFIYLKASVVIAFIYYLIGPVSKVILLPLNIITLGLVSVVFYSLTFYFILDKLSLIRLESWNFSGLSFLGVIIIPFLITKITNIFFASVSVSVVISLLEKIL